MVDRRFTREITHLAQRDAGVQPVHKIVNVDPELRVERVQPLRQVLLHRQQILVRGPERPVRPRLQQHRHGPISESRLNQPLFRGLQHQARAAINFSREERTSGMQSSASRPRN